ncbi:MAG: YfhO family protein, partial [Anaerorhabdus sp.]
TTYISVNEPNVMTFVNTKYALVANESQLPIGVDWELITNNYRGWVSVYRNKNYRPLGTMYDAVKVYDDYSNTEDFLNYVLCDEEDFDEILNNLNDNSGILENIRYKDNYLLGTIESDGGFMVLTLPYDEGWNIKINGTEIEKYEVNGGFIGLTIPSGKVSLEMYYSIPGLKIGGIISGIGVAMLAIAITIDLILKRRQL